MIHRLEAKVSVKGTWESDLMSLLVFNVSNKFNKPDEGKVFCIESRSLRMTEIDLSQHNTVQIMNI